MLARINSLKNWQVAIIIAVVGIAVFATGLANPFQGDDGTQILSNIPVHSISNIRQFFEGGTTYNINSAGVLKLTGNYYRPLMTTVYSLIYTIFGPHTLYFHLFQLLVCIGSTILLFLVFKYSFNTLLSLILAFVFLVHPIDSQVVFAIPSMQDALFVFFGMLAIWILLRFISIRSLFIVSLCLFLSLLSKENGLLFVIMALVYLLWWSRKRFYYFVGIMIMPIVIWFTLRIHAVGLLSRPLGAPIDRLNLANRMLTAPSLLQFYITKLIFPWKLATGYYWTYTTFSIAHVLLPLIIDILVIGVVIYTGILVHARATKSQYHTFLFFAIWAAIGLIGCLQISPLDLTACETWFYFPMIGVLGMAGVTLVTFQKHIKPKIFISIVLLTLILLAGRTAIRGTNYSSVYKLASYDVKASPQDFNTDDQITLTLINERKYSEAIPYVLNSIKVFPYANNYSYLGEILTYTGDYQGAQNAYEHALLYGHQTTTYEDLATLTLLYGNVASNERFLNSELKILPNNYTIWMYLALLEDKNGQNSEAKVAITKAISYGPVVPNLVYYGIMNDQPFTMPNLFNTGMTYVVR